MQNISLQKGSENGYESQNRKSRTKRRTKAFAAAVMGKPSGQIQERVKQVGPEHFGVVSVDCAKDRSKWMLADFYGRVLIPPTSVEHRRSEIQLALLTLKLAVEKHGIKDTIVAWAGNAVVGDPMRSMMTRIWQSLLIDWQQKTQQIIALERDIASLLVQTPWVLLMSHPGINVVSAAELAAETGPIEHYASSKAITGRAGLFPSRYQSDGGDRGGNLSRFRNAKMRAAWLLAAECLLKRSVPSKPSGQGCLLRIYAPFGSSPAARLSQVVLPIVWPFSINLPAPLCSTGVTPVSKLIRAL